MQSHASLWKKFLRNVGVMWYKTVYEKSMQMLDKNGLFNKLMICFDYWEDEERFVLLTDLRSDSY